jgi:hypothetical protein
MASLIIATGCARSLRFSLSKLPIRTRLVCLAGNHCFAVGQQIRNEFRTVRLRRCNVGERSSVTARSGVHQGAGQSREPRGLSTASSAAGPILGRDIYKKLLLKSAKNDGASEGVRFHVVQGGNAQEPPNGLANAVNGRTKTTAS